MQVQQTDRKGSDDLRISVALCTFNGERFLEEQLESILTQSRLPDELVICDDRSTDATANIIQRFQRQAPFDVKFSINEVNLGTSKNFERSVTLCTGDILVLSDQDDVWVKDRLKSIESVFKVNPDLGLVFSDATVVDENLTPLGYTLWDSIRFGKRGRDLVRSGRSLEVLLRQNVVTGATVGFNSKYLKCLLPFAVGCMHDEWLALMFALMGRIVMIEQPLILYRQHNCQQIGAKEDGSTIRHYAGETLKAATGPQKFLPSVRLEYLRWLEADWNLFNAAIKRAVTYELDPTATYSLREKISHLETRRRLLLQPRYKRFPGVAHELARGRYRLYSNGLAYIAKDLLI